MTLSELEEYILSFLVFGSIIFITIIISILQHRNLGNKVENQNDVVKTMVINEEEENENDDYYDHLEGIELCQERNCAGCDVCSIYT